MESFFIIMALALPALLGVLWLGLFVPPTTGGRTALVWGNGLLAGLLVIPMLMRLLDALGAPLRFGATASVAGGLILLAASVHLYWQRKPAGRALQKSDWSNLPQSHKILIAFIGTLLAVRLTTLGLELLWRPLFPWDATMHWATKARVWFDAGRIVPFVENKEWLERSGEGVFTDHHPGYPITTPLLQVWMNSAIGRWDESLMNLPWLLCLLAMGSAFFGQARASGAGLVVALVFCYFLLSMPLINTHVALAGYADLFLGACYCAALMAFHNWSVQRQPWQAGMAVFFALSCTLIKNEGFYWLLTFIPALVVVMMPGRKAALLLSCLLLAAIGLLALFSPDLAVAGHSLNRLRLHYRPEALAGIGSIFWVHDSWHLFAYLLILVLPAGLIRSGSRASNYQGIIAALASAVGLFLILFLFTRYASGAVRFTAVGRISAQLIPGLVFLAMLLTSELLTTDRGKPSARGEIAGPIALG
jgi:hypothetical protein